MAPRMGSERPAVTVVIPTRNRRDLLEEAVASALEQGGVDVEVVVVDDGSTDGTQRWLDGLANPRVRHLRLDPARERTAARNAGLACAVTPYVLFLDDDDLLAPQALRRLAGALERHRVAPVAAGTYATFGTYGPKELPRQPTIGRLPIRRRMWREILWGWYLLPGAGLWRTDHLRDMGGWDETRTFAEDLELSLRVHPYPMALVPHPVLRYRQHGRHVDDATEARWEQDNAEVRRRFLAQLPPAERAVGQRVVDARPTFQRALAAYASGDYGTAARGLLRGIRAAPSLMASPVLGPMFIGMLVKSVLAQAAPERVRRRVREARQARRAERFGPGAA
jgi:glycosyltransferase involved in cell wall biosynthesis